VTTKTAAVVVAEMGVAAVTLPCSHYRVLLDREEPTLLKRVTRAKGSAIPVLRAIILKRLPRKGPIEYGWYQVIIAEFVRIDNDASTSVS
jgi:hypothetical protein